MSLLSSLYTGSTGMQASTLDLSVIGDNIANANTVGFKGSRAAFEDALSQTLIGDSGQVGLGVGVASVRTILTQGSLTNTGVATDLALQGNGLFVLKGAHQGQDGTYYSRAGQFTTDKDGYLVNLEGLRVQGYGADQTGVLLSGGLGDVKIGGASAAPRATGNVTIRGNLQADAAIKPAWDPANPDTTSNFSTSAQVFDSLGTVHQVSVYFRRTGAGAWEYHASTDGAGVTGGTAGTPFEIAAGTLTYDANGKLTDQTQTGTFQPVGASSPQALTLNLGDPTSTARNTGLAGLTQFSATSAVSFLGQDGAASGTVTSVRVETDGNIVGAFSNGESRVLGQVAVATFSAPDELARAGGNLYSRGPNAGEPSVGTAGTGGRGSISAGALEQSNVDLGTEFVKMISAQRQFQANSKTIMTADSLLAELIQIKR